MNHSTRDRCPRRGATEISYGGGHMACCGGCGLIADEEVFEVSIEEIVTDEMVADFADGAREGGSNYWCDQLYCLQDSDRPRTYFGEQLAAGAWYAAAEYDDDPHRRTWYPLDAARMRVGISRAAERSEEHTHELQSRLHII